MQYAHSDGFSVVDLHWRLTPKSFSPFIEPEKLFARSQKVSVAGHQSRRLPTKICFSTSACMRRNIIGAVWSGSLRFLSWCVPDRSIGKSLTTRRKRPEVKTCFTSRSCCCTIFFQFHCRRNSAICRLAAITCETAVPEKIQERLFAETPGPPTQLEMFRLIVQYMDRRRDAIASLLR